MGQNKYTLDFIIINVSSIITSYHNCQLTMVTFAWRNSIKILSVLRLNLTLIPPIGTLLTMHCDCT